MLALAAPLLALAAVGLALVARAHVRAARRRRLADLAARVRASRDRLDAMAAQWAREDAADDARIAALRAERERFAREQPKRPRWGS